MEKTTYICFKRDRVGNEEPYAFCPDCGYCSDEFDHYVGKYMGVYCSASQQVRETYGKCGYHDLFLMCPNQKDFYNITYTPGYEHAVCHGKEGTCFKLVSKEEVYAWLESKNNPATPAVQQLLDSAIFIYKVGLLKVTHLEDEYDYDEGEVVRWKTAELSDAPCGEPFHFQADCLFCGKHHTDHLSCD